MGIHSGPVNEVRDVNDHANIAGAGINIAQRIMDCGDEGHILLSKRVADDLAQSRQWRPYLHDLGECAVKHGLPVFVVNLYTDEVGNSEPPRRFTEQVAATRKSSRRATWKIAAAALLILLLVAGGALWSLRHFGLTGSNKSIAVLPFENFSDEKENEFFADGIQDDILTALAQIEGLRVISRTSVMSFRGAKESHNLGAISKLLNVANILEGSVRREGSRVVVNVQLIDARHDRHLWANRYDRQLQDALGLQGELAGEIADALRVTLSQDEKARVVRQPTASADAYVIYLRANHIERNPDTLLAEYEKAEQLYQQAIEIDPQFALAHARLSSTCAQIYHYFEPTETVGKKAREQAETALRLQGNLAEAHLALGQCLYWIDGKYEEALGQFDNAARLSPNNTEVVRLIAALKRRQGHWDESLKAYERIQERDPQDPNIARNLLFTYTSLRMWPESARAAERMRAMAPASLVAKIQSGYVDFWWKGETSRLKALLESVPPGNDPDGAVTSCRWEVAMIDRDFVGARRILEASPVTELSYMNSGPTPKDLAIGMSYLAEGDQANALKHFEIARPLLEKALQEAPESADRHANLGWLYSMMGRKEEAMREGLRAVELKPEEKDAYDGIIMKCYLALIYARAGEAEKALPLLERLLKVPGAVDSADYSISVNDLKYRWEWDPIRKDPRFQKLLTNP